MLMNYEITYDTCPMPSRSRRSERRRHENICGKLFHNSIASTAHTV